jgi:hypothetical protein
MTRAMTHCPPAETAIYQKLRQMHCDDRHPGHECQGRLVIDRNGITLACPRCGDARSAFAPERSSP